MIDNRGRTVRVCRRKDLPRTSSAHVRTATKLAEMGSARWIVSQCALYTVLLGVQVAYPLRHHANQITAFLKLFGAGVLVLVGLLFVAVRVKRDSREELVSEALLAEWLCPSCAYSLEGATCEADGCSVCPECGAAWRIPGATAGEQA